MANKSKAKAHKDYTVCHLAATLFKKIGTPSVRDKNAIQAALRHAYEYGKNEANRKPVVEKPPAQPNVIWVGHNSDPLMFSG